MQSEEQVGITCFVHEDLPGFTGILKQRFNDFLVNEITEEGEVLHLTSTELPAEEAPTPPPAPTSIGTLLQRTAALLGQHQADELEAWLQAVKTSTKGKGGKAGNATHHSTQVPQHVLLGPIGGGKDDRTAVHLLFKGHFEHKLRFDTTTVHLEATQGNDGSTGGGHASAGGPNAAPAAEDATAREEEGNNAVNDAANCQRNVGAPAGWSRGSGSYVRVQLVKAGVKRQRSEGNLAWPGGQSHRHLSFVLLKINRDTSVIINTMARYIGIKPSALCTAGNKDKRAVTVQRMTCQRVTATRVASAVKGIQGVYCGNFAYAQRAVALGALQGNQFQIIIRNVQGATDAQVQAALQGLTVFINYFGLQRFGNDDMPTHRVGAAILRGDWQGACGLLLGARSRDREEVQAARAAYASGDVQGALRLMPRECVAERAVLEGLKRNGPAAWKPALLNIPRNLRTLYAHAYQSYLWNAAASHRVQTYGVKGAVAGDLVLPPGGVGKAGALDRSTARLEAVHVVTQEEADAGVYGICDVVLPLPGSQVLYPSHDTAAVYHTLADQDGVNLQGAAGVNTHMTNSSGDYRHVVQAPLGLAFQVFRYDDANAELATNDREMLERSTTQDGVLAAAIKQEGSLLGLRVSFQLPTSCYATMLLRELMKGSTSVVVHAIRTKQASMGSALDDDELPQQ